MKIDHYLLKDYQKQLTILGLLLGTLLTIYTALFIIISRIAKKMRVKKKRVVIAHIMVLLASIIWLNSMDDYGASDFIIPYFHYLQYFLLIDPVRIIIASSYSLYFLFCGHILSEGMEDWVVQEEKRKRKEFIKDGAYDYEDRSHALVYGATRSGKGVFLNHLIKDRLMRPGELLVMISAKLASGDRFSQLDYLKKKAKEAGRKLYVISMDPERKDRVQYNPFKHLQAEEMLNALESLLETDSHFYTDNFVQWVMSIWDLLKVSNRTVSLENILKLYAWEAKSPDKPSYSRFLRQLLDNKEITQEQYDTFMDEEIEIYAKTAQNDRANLRKIARACVSVFNPTPSGRQITITDAFRENALIYFDLNGASSAASVKMLGVCIMQELQHCMVEYSDGDQRKTIICDEASYYLHSQLVKSFLNVSASMGYQFVISTQGSSDIGDYKNAIIHQINNNVGQLCLLRIGDPEDVENINALIGTTITAENTHRAMSVEYDLTGSVKAKDQMYISYDEIKNLEPLTMICYQKTKSVEGEARPVRVKWRTDDL